MVLSSRRSDRIAGLLRGRPRASLHPVDESALMPRHGKSRSVETHLERMHAKQEAQLTTMRAAAMVCGQCCVSDCKVLKACAHAIESGEEVTKRAGDGFVPVQCSNPACTILMKWCINEDRSRSASYLFNTAAIRHRTA